VTNTGWPRGRHHKAPSPLIYKQTPHSPTLRRHDWNRYCHDSDRRADWLTLMLSLSKLQPQQLARQTLAGNTAHNNMQPSMALNWIVKI
jgi:microcystin-dependent protein